MRDDIDLERLQKRLQKLGEKKRGAKSVRAWAKDAGISYTYVAQIEGRKKKKSLKRAPETSPTVFMLNRYLRHCGLTLAQFFADFEGAAPEPYAVAPEHAALLEDVRDLLQAGPEAERRVRERIEDVQAWLRTQPAPQSKSKKRKEA
jgi:transcriptional regulator with XRE-family HTH domain